MTRSAANQWDCDRAWQGLLTLKDAQRHHGPPIFVSADAPERWRDEPIGESTFGIEASGGLVVPAGDDAVSRFLHLYLPIVAGACRPTFVVAHLGQSLDGRIATSNGASQWVTGPEDIAHNHRLRALCDAVIVGAGTVRHDDPRLTVRCCEGSNPVRVVIDTNRRLDSSYGVFGDGVAPTILLAAQDLVEPGQCVGDAPVIGIPRARDHEGLDAVAIIARLAEHNLKTLFVEGGGITVSRFLQSGVLDRLQVTVAPLILGSGRPSVVLPEIDSIDGGIRPETRRYALGDDILFDCKLA